jgi:hypothetical protein
MTKADWARRLDWALLERVYVILVALHTFAVGAGLFFVSEWALRFGGWEVIPPLFFPRQAGIFHFILGIAYIEEHRRAGSVSLLIMAKTFAVVFLVGAALFANVPWFVPVAGIGDGLMALLAWLLHRQVRHAAAERVRAAHL